MTQHSVCPCLEVWRRFHAGDVSDEELESLAAHQENCASCRDRLASLDLPVRDAECSTMDDRATQGFTGGMTADETARLEVESVLGEGGMGRVWVAHDGEVGRHVAVKRLKPEYETDPGLRARFLAEARVTGQLEHPGIVPVYRVLERPDGSPAYSMRLVRGRTLLEAAREYHRRGDHDRLALFLAALPRRLRTRGSRSGTVERPLTHVMEFRHPSWYVPETFDLLGRERVSLCLHDKEGSAIAGPAVGPAVYVRFHGTSGRYHGSYDEPTLRRWASRFDGWARERRPVFAYFNNDPEAVAVANAGTLRRLLRQDAERPA